MEEKLPTISKYTKLSAELDKETKRRYQYTMSIPIVLKVEKPYYMVNSIVSYYKKMIVCTVIFQI